MPVTPRPAARAPETAAAMRSNRLARTRHARSRERRRRRLVTALFVCAALLAGTYLMGWSFRQPHPEPVSGGEPGPGEPTVAPTGAPEPSPSPPESPAPPVLSLPGDFPGAGPGTFQIAQTSGESLGSAGTLRRFRVAVEDGIDEDLVGFVAVIDETLGDERGWTAGGQYRFQQVPAGAAYDFTIYLVTGETAATMCGAVGLNIRDYNGVPYTSCRAPGQVIINLNRWRLSVPEYLADEVPLEIYRQMVLNHEVGHELGYGHEQCPGAGQPAPVMQQQTLFLNGCVANQWPFLDGQRYAGAPTN